MQCWGDVAFALCDASLIVVTGPGAGPPQPMPLCPDAELTIVLDLDETLVHAKDKDCMTYGKYRPGGAVEVVYLPSTTVITAEYYYVSKDKPEQAEVNVRTGVVQFLRFLRDERVYAPAH